MNRRILRLDIFFRNIRIYLAHGFCLGLISILAHAALPYPRQANSSLNLKISSSTTSFHFFLGDPINELSFDKPVAVRSVPGETNRLFIVERSGRIMVITNLAKSTKSVFMDITGRVSSDYDRLKTEGLTSMAFHPQYAQNGLFYVTYCWRNENKNYNRLSEFKASSNPNAGDPGSERVLISQFDEGDGHNFNDVHFGPDGFLYMLTGDEGDGGNGDDFHNAQKIDRDFFSGMIRIDPIRKTGQVLPNPHPAVVGDYGIPTDNPYVNAQSFNGIPLDPTKVRAEFFAVGLRNPWRFSFDPLDGTIYAGDVGQHGREEINVIVKGGNYGWSYKEGSLPGPRSPAPSAVNLLPPIQEYNHGRDNNTGQSVTGGVVYRGTKYPDLYGDYIFSDYVSGNVWALRYDGGLVSPYRLLMKQADLAGFGHDPRNGDILLINHYGGRIFSLQYRVEGGSTIPEKLSQTGAFANLQTLEPHPGIIPYDLNHPFWSDNAQKRRWFTVPGNKTIAFSEEGNWTFPTNTIWIKHFELEMKKGDPSSSRRLETRFLVKTANGVVGLTYKWDPNQLDATLVPEAGATETFTIDDGGTSRQQVWKYPSRSDCLACHTAGGGFALGFNTLQLNRDMNYKGTVLNQLSALSQANYFTQPVSNIHAMRKLASLKDDNVSRAFRVKSYLAANCSFCHQPGGSAHATFDAHSSRGLSDSGIINGSVFNSGGDPLMRVITPGDVTRSAIVKRMKALDNIRMPPIGSTVVDQEAVALLEAWITGDLPGYKTFEQWQAAHFPSGNDQLSESGADPDKDGADNKYEYLTGTNPNNRAEAWKINIGREKNVGFVQLPHLAFVLEMTDSFHGTPQWLPWDHPSNSPFYSKTSFPKSLTPPATSTNKFFRIKILEP